MNQRLIALALAMTFGLALGANIVSTEDERPATAALVAAESAEKKEAAGTTGSDAAKPDAEGTLSFENIGAQMLKNNYSMLALQESIDDIDSHDYQWKEDDLRDKLNGIADLQWLVLTDSPFASVALSAAGMPDASAQSLQTAYDSLRTQFDDLRDGTTQRDDADEKRQYRQMQNLMVMGAETLYIAILGIEQSDAALTRKAAAMDRSLAALRVMQSNGVVSELNVQQMENGLAQLRSGQQTLRMNEETTLLQLKAMVGAELGEPLELGDLPRVTAEQLDAMDIETDLADAMEASYDLYDAQKQIDAFQKDYYDKVMDNFSSTSKAFEVSQVKHGLQSLKYKYESDKQNFELKFRTLYAKVKDCAQTLEAAKSALALEEKNYAVSAIKSRQGTISQNALADAADTLAEAKDTMASAERDLFTQYRSYQWAVQYGILNS